MTKNFAFQVKIKKSRVSRFLLKRKKIEIQWVNFEYVLNVCVCPKGFVVQKKTKHADLTHFLHTFKLKYVAMCTNGMKHGKDFKKKSTEGSFRSDNKNRMFFS